MNLLAQTRLALADIGYKGNVNSYEEIQSWFIKIYNINPHFISLPKGFRAQCHVLNNYVVSSRLYGEKSQTDHHARVKSIQLAIEIVLELNEINNYEPTHIEHDTSN